MKKMLQTLHWFLGNQTTQNSDTVAKLPNDPLNANSARLPTHDSFTRRLVLTCLVFVTLFFSSTLFSQEVTKKVTNFELKDEVIKKLYSADGPYARFKPENEIVSERKESVKVFDNKNGTNTMLMSAGPMHFLEDGVWKTTSNEIISNKEKNSQEYPYVNLHNSLKTLYGNISTGIQIYKNRNEIAVKKYKVEGIKLYDVNKQEKQTITKFNSVDPILLNNGKIAYNLAGDVNYQIEQLTGKIKSQYVIDKNLFSTYDSLEYIGFEEIITFNEEVYIADKNVGKNSGITFVNEKGQEILNYSDAFYFTKETENSLHHDEAHYVVKEIDNKSYKVTILIPVVWFQKSDTKYPVIVDPSIICYPTNSSYWTGFTVNTGSGSNDPMVVGFYDCAGCTDEDYRPFSKFDISGIPDNACINSATYWLYQYTWTNGNGNDGLTFDIGWGNTDPVPDSWNTIYNAFKNPAERYYSWNVWGGIGACGGCNGGADYNEGLTGWHEMGINYALAKNRIQTRLTSDYITLGADLTGHANDCFTCVFDETNWLRWYGYSNANRPQLQIDYQANNACADATTVTDGSVTFNTTCATQDQSAPSCGTGTFNQVWYKYTTGASARTITVSTCNAATFDTRIAVYKGSCGSLTAVGCNDDGSGCSLTSTLTFSACPNTSYLIAVGGYNGAVGSGTLTISSSTVTNLSASAGSAETICYNTSSVLGGSPTASNGFGSYSYSWTGGATSANPSVTLTGTATYTVTVTDAGGCTATASKVVTVRPDVSAAVASSTLASCADPSDPYAVLSATAPTVGSGTWSITSGSGTLASTTANPTTITGLSTTGASTQVKWEVAYASAPTCPKSQTLTITPTSLASIGQVSLQNDGAATSTGIPVQTRYACRTCSVKNGNTYTYFDAVGKIIATIVDKTSNAADLGSTEVCIGYDYTPPTAPTSANVKTITTNIGYVQPYLPRSWTIKPAAGSDATVTLYFTAAELTALQQKANATVYQFSGFSGLAVTKYPGGTGAGQFIAPKTTGGVFTLSTFSGYNSDYKVTFDVNSFSTFYVHPQTYPFAVLPVELVSFTGYNNKDQNVLNWTTASEKNSDRFEVEKSTDGISGWNYLGWQKAVGGNVQKSYTFTDNQPVVGNNYYRLKIIDNDGTYTFSNTINIPIDVAMVNGIVRVFPNPTNGLVNIQLQSIKNAISILQVTNLLGQVIKSSELTLQTGITSVDVDLHELSSGTYIVSFIDALGNKHQEKVIKQ